PRSSGSIARWDGTKSFRPVAWPTAAKTARSSPRASWPYPSLGTTEASSQSPGRARRPVQRWGGVPALMAGMTGRPDRYRYRRRWERYTSMKLMPHWLRRSVSSGVIIASSPGTNPTGSPTAATCRIRSPSSSREPKPLPLARWWTLTCTLSRSAPPSWAARASSGSFLGRLTTSVPRPYRSRLMFLPPPSRPPSPQAQAVRLLRLRQEGALLGQGGPQGVRVHLPGGHPVLEGQGRGDTGRVAHGHGEGREPQRGQGLVTGRDAPPRHQQVGRALGHQGPVGDGVVLPFGQAPGLVLGRGRIVDVDGVRAVDHPVVEVAGRQDVLLGHLGLALDPPALPHTDLGRHRDDVDLLEAGHPPAQEVDQLPDLAAALHLRPGQLPPLEGGEPLDPGGVHHRLAGPQGFEDQQALARDGELPRRPGLLQEGGEGGEAPEGEAAEPLGVDGPVDGHRVLELLRMLLEVVEDPVPVDAAYGEDHGHGLGQAVLLPAHLERHPHRGGQVAVSGGVDEEPGGQLLHPILLPDPDVADRAALHRRIEKEGVEPEIDARLHAHLLEDPLQPLVVKGGDAGAVVDGVRHMPG